MGVMKLSVSQDKRSVGTRAAASAAASLCADLLSFGSATLHEAQRQTGAMSHVIKPIDGMMRLAGPALTVSARPGDNLIVHYAITKAAAGDVLVIDAQGFVEAGLWGDLLTEAAIQAGICGVVVDGAVRDYAAICQLGFPVFARALSIKGTNKFQPGTVGEDIICAGASVRRGDIVVGDQDGVVVVRHEQTAAVLDGARKRKEAEDVVRRELKQGRTTIEIMNLSAQLNRLGLN